MHIGRGILQVYVCSGLHGIGVQGRQGRVQAEAVRKRKVPQYARKLHVSLIFHHFSTPALYEFGLELSSFVHSLLIDSVFAYANNAFRNLLPFHDV